MTATIEDLPDELLEHILGIVSPYKDLDCCKLVSKKWNNAMKRVVLRKQCNLVNALTTNKLAWEYGDCGGLSLRYIHSACYHGFSKNHTTAFNDLVSFDLTAREWKRILGTGDFPQPKAGASLCAYKDKLILYGGCTRTRNLQPLITFMEMHTFDLKEKVWTNLGRSLGRPPALSCHSASMHQNLMVVYGGVMHNTHLNDQIYCFDVDTWMTTQPKCIGAKPPAIYGGSQIYIDDYHLLLTGGWWRVGINGPSQPNQSSWLLSMNKYPWQWSNINDENVQWMPPKRMFICTVVSKVGDYLVSFSHADEDDANNKKEPEPAVVNPEPEENVNGRRGNFRNQQQRQPENPRIQPVLGPLYTPRRSMERRQQRLDVLSKYEKKYAIEDVAKPKKSSDMALYVGYIGNLLNTMRIIWKEPRCTSGLQSYRVLYSQSVGRSEIILFGGLAWNGGDSNEQAPLVEHNALAIVKAPRHYL